MTARRSVVPVTYINSSAAIKAFCRRTRRRRLHVVERRGDAAVGVGTRRADPVPAGSASRSQHGVSRWAFRSIGWSSGIRTRSRGGLESLTPRSRARIILWKGHCSVHTRFTRAANRAGPRSTPGRARDRASRGAVGRRSGGGRSGSTEYIIKPREGEPGRFHLGRRDRNPPRQSARARGRARAHASSRSISSAACARRCSACRRTICSGYSKDWSPARSTTASSFPGDQKHWTRVALDRMLSIP